MEKYKSNLSIIVAGVCFEFSEATHKFYYEALRRYHEDADFAFAFLYLMKECRLTISDLANIYEDDEALAFETLNAMLNHLPLLMYEFEKIAVKDITTIETSATGKKAPEEALSKVLLDL